MTHLLPPVQVAAPSLSENRGRSPLLSAGAKVTQGNSEIRKGQPVCEATRHYGPVKRNLRGFDRGGNGGAPAVSDVCGGDCLLPRGFRGDAGSFVCFVF